MRSGRGGQRRRAHPAKWQAYGTVGGGGVGQGEGARQAAGGWRLARRRARRLCRRFWLSLGADDVLGRGAVCTLVAGETASDCKLRPVEFPLYHMGLSLQCSGRGYHGVKATSVEADGGVRLMLSVDLPMPGCDPKGRVLVPHDVPQKEVPLPAFALAPGVAERLRTVICPLPPTDLRALARWRRAVLGRKNAALAALVESGFAEWWHIAEWQDFLNGRRAAAAALSFQRQHQARVSRPGMVVHRDGGEVAASNQRPVSAGDNEGGARKIWSAEKHQKWQTECEKLGIQLVEDLEKPPFDQGVQNYTTGGAMLIVAEKMVAGGFVCTARQSYMHLRYETEKHKKQPPPPPPPAPAASQARDSSVVPSTPAASSSSSSSSPPATKKREPAAVVAKPGSSMGAAAVQPKAKRQCLMK